MSYLGLLKRKEVWALTLRGWITAFMVFAVILIVFIFKIQPFLAITKPVNCDVMVVEGWFPDQALQKIVQEFKLKKYRLLLVTGGPIDQGYFYQNIKTMLD